MTMLGAGPMSIPETNRLQPLFGFRGGKEHEHYQLFGDVEEAVLNSSRDKDDAALADSLLFGTG